MAEAGIKYDFDAAAYVRSFIYVFDIVMLTYTWGQKKPKPVVA